MPLLSTEDQEWLLDSLADLVARRGAGPLLGHPLPELTDPDKRLDGDEQLD